MNGPKCESDNRGGIKFYEESGAKLEYDCLSWTAIIPHGKNFLKRFSCRLSLPKRIPQLTPENRNLPIKFSSDKDHFDDPNILRGGADGTVWIIFKRLFFS